MNMHHPIQQVKTYLWNLQAQLCKTFAHLDAQERFRPDHWDSSLGTGISCVLEKGAVFEKAGINVSHVAGTQLPSAALQKKSHLINQPFQALGISLVLHPQNPYVPTTHANLRFFTTEAGEWWFGGGFDLTPYYGFEADAIHWHTEAKAACTPFGDDLYPRFKRWCDEYFYLPHRQEARGIGGLFFDHFQLGSFEQGLAFIQSVGTHFLAGYQPIVERRLGTPYGEREKQFQQYRRGRYVEFNLLYDRGTLFGLQSNGRTESILMSLPPTVNWTYNWQPEPHSPEAVLYTDFLPAKTWVPLTPDCD